MLPWKLRKRQILLVSQNLSSLYFSLAKFQLVSCNLSLAIIWQMTYTQKLPKLCSATLNHVTRWSPVRFQATAASKWPTCWQLVSFDLQISSWSFRWRYLPFLQLRGSTLYVFFFSRMFDHVQRRQRNVQSCCFAYSNLLLFWRSRWILFLLGSFSKDVGDGNESVKKAIGLLRKTTLHVRHAFLLISLPSLHDYDVGMSNFTFQLWRP